MASARFFPYLPIIVSFFWFNGFVSAAPVTSCDEASLRAALGGGGTITFECDGTIVLTNTLWITNNTVLDGTGRKVTLSGNQTVRVLDVSAQLTLINVTIADGGQVVSGAGLLNRGSCRLVNCTFSNNVAVGAMFGPGAGGAICLTPGSSLSVDGCAFLNNRNQGTGSSIGVGGAIGFYGFGPQAPPGPISITNTLFYGNAANFGGAINFSCQFGGLSANLVNCTFVDNTNGALASFCSVTRLQNCLFSNAPGASISGEVVDVGHNISSDSSGNFTHLFSLNSSDPKLGPLGDYGGPTLSVPLLQGSPAIDAGSATVCPATDQRGVARPFGSYCDVGAFEAPFPSTHPAILQVAAAAGSVVETNTNIVVTVARIGDTAGNAAVQFSTSNGTAQAGADFAGVNLSLAFTPGQRTNAVVIGIVDDAVGEPVEDFFGWLSNPSAGTTLGRAMTRATIADNDVSFAFSAAEYRTNEAAGEAIIAVIRVGNPAPSVSVGYSATQDSALTGLDFNETTGTLAFASGQTNATFGVRIRNDSVTESEEAARLTLSMQNAGTSLVEPSTARLVIVDDDPAPRVQFSRAEYSVAEGMAEAIVTIGLDHPASYEIAVNFATANGSAVAGGDYVATNGTAVFRPGQLDQLVRIPLIDDGSGEPNESFTLSLTDPGSGATLGSLSTATIAIVDRSEIISSCDESALRAAMAAGGRVSLGCSGTIILSSPIVVSNAVKLDDSGQDVTLSGGGIINHFIVNPGVALSLHDLVLRDGLALGTNGSPGVAGGNGQGGAAYNNGGTLLAQNCLFISNKAQGGSGGVSSSIFQSGGSGGLGQGGAIYSSNRGQVLLLNSRLEFNSAIGGDGGIGSGSSVGGAAAAGALYNADGILRLDQCTVASNFVTSGVGRRFGASLGRIGPTYGGGILTRRTLELNRAILSHNVAQVQSLAPARGGAVYQEEGWSGISTSFLSGNQAHAGRGLGISTPSGLAGGDAFGGGISVAQGVLVIMDSTLAHNLALGGSEPGTGSLSGSGLGGAIFSAGEVFAMNVTLTENQALSGAARDFSGLRGSANGGAVCNLSGAATFSYTTIARNAASNPNGGVGRFFGGGIYSTNGATVVSNSIVAYSLSGSNCWGQIVDGGHNLSSDDSCNFNAAGSMANTDPILGPLADYHGFAPTVALLANSPALDAAASSSCPATDQRGVPRPFGSGCDIGAFESAPPYTIVGSIDGYLQSPGGIDVSAPGSSARVGADGNYVLHGFSPGPVLVTPGAVDAIFILSNQLVNVTADVAGVNFYSYRSNTFLIRHSPGATVTLIFAGARGETWKVLSSTNVSDWSPWVTNTIAANGLFQSILTEPTDHRRVFRGQKLE